MTISFAEINRVTARIVFPQIVRDLWDSLGVPYEPGWPENLPDAEFERLVDCVTRAHVAVMKEWNDG